MTCTSGGTAGSEITGFVTGARMRTAENLACRAAGCLREAAEELDVCLREAAGELPDVRGEAGQLAAGLLGAAAGLDEAIGRLRALAQAPGSGVRGYPAPAVPAPAPAPEPAAAESAGGALDAARRRWAGTAAEAPYPGAWRAVLLAVCYYGPLGLEEICGRAEEAGPPVPEDAVGREVAALLIRGQLVRTGDGKVGRPGRDDIPAGQEAPRQVWRIGSLDPGAARTALTADAAVRMLRDAYRLRTERQARLGRSMPMEEHRRLLAGTEELLIVITDEAAPWFAGPGGEKMRRVLHALARSSPRCKIRFWPSPRFIASLPVTDWQSPFLSSLPDVLLQHVTAPRRRPASAGSGS